MLPWVPKAAPTTDLAATPPTTAAPAIAPPTATGTATAPPVAGATAPPVGATPPVAGAPPPPATGTIYLQFSASQNSDWADAFAKQLKDGGFPAKVLDPKTADEAYRVVVGPYSTRAVADSVGKRVGRPYFIITQGAGDT